MARFVTGLFGGNRQTQPPATALRVNSSLQGVSIPLLLGGMNRLGANLIDWFNFFSENQPSNGGGKGGGGGKGAAGGQQSYFVSVILAIAEVIGGATIYSIWVNGTLITGNGLAPGIFGFGAVDDNATFPAEAFPGDYAQQPWGFAASQSGVRGALGYRGIAYAAFENAALGDSPTLPNLTFELAANGGGGNASNVVPGQPDGDASIALSAFLTNPYFGVGFPALRLGALTAWQQYCLALGFGVSPVLASSTQASAFINDLVGATNAAPCWQDGAFTVVPYGDAAVSAGAIEQSVETYEVPTGRTFPDPPNPDLEYPQITVSFYGTFAGDGGVTYESGEPLTRVGSYAPSGVANSGSPGVGQYVVSGGVYYFNPADVGQTVIISYNYAAVGSYVPDTTPIYDFTIDDCLPNELSIGQGISDPSSPFMVVRKPRDQMLNNIKVEYLDRNNAYNPVDIEVKDEAAIILFKRERPSELKQLHFFCLAGAAQQSAALSLIRQQVARTAQWTVGRHFAIILQLMALVTISDPGQGLDQAPFRIIEIQENEDFSLTVTAEEFLGTVSAPLYGSQPSQGATPNYNADPGSINPPIIFEPTAELNQTNSLGGLQIWAAVSGQNLPQWGGCNVWASYDGENYQKVGAINGAARMGTLTAALLAVAPSPTGPPTLDTTDSLIVNLAQSGGQLSSGTQADALALNTRCYVGPQFGPGEIVAYETATLTAANNYDLTYLVRGAYGTEVDIANWPVGSFFARLDAGIFQLAFDQSRIGSTLYLKFQSFNIYGGGNQDLADCTAFQYAIKGTALASPLPDVANLRTVYDVNTGFTDLVWDPISDFRQFTYEVRSGSSWDAALTLSADASSPFRVPGNGTYWVAAVAQPAPGLTVYSEEPADVVITGAVITQNVILTVDLKAANWPGTFYGGAGVDNSLDAIRTGGGNILADSGILTTSDILDYGGGLSGAYYPLDAYLDIGYVTTVSVAMTYQPTGVPVGQDALAVGDILGTPDILGSASTAFIDVYPLINQATAIGGDLYSLGDLYQYADLYEASEPDWAGFQKFAPGTYQARYLNAAMVLDTVDPNTIAYDLEWTITFTIPSRIDTVSLTTSASGATAVTFTPTGQSAAPFNGGPATGNKPAIQGTIIGAQAGDQLIISGETLSGCNVEVTNSGAPVARSIILTVQGY